MLKQDWAGLNLKKLPISIMRNIEKITPSFLSKHDFFCLSDSAIHPLIELDKKKETPVLRNHFFWTIVAFQIQCAWRWWRRTAKNGAYKKRLELLSARA